MISDKDLVRFKKICESYTKKNTLNKQAAINCLIREGIYDKDGLLAEQYGGPKRH